MGRTARGAFLGCERPAEVRADASLNWAPSGGGRVEPCATGRRREAFLPRVAEPAPRTATYPMHFSLIPAPTCEEATMGLFSKDIKNLEDLYQHGLKDIYYAENQIVKVVA